MKKIVVTGPEPGSGYGTSQVTKYLTQVSTGKDYNIDFIPTNSQQLSKFGKARYFLSALLNLFRKKNQADGFHLFVNRGMDLWRNYAFLKILKSISAPKLLRFGSDLPTDIEKTKNRIPDLDKMLVNDNYYYMVPSNSMRNKYISYFSLSPDKIFVVNNPLPVKKLQDKFMVENNSNSDNLKIIFLGALKPRKGIYDFLKLASNFKNKEQLEFIVAGSGKNSEKYKKEFNFKNLTFTGYIKGEKKWELLASSDIMIIPSKISESFGIVAIEAMCFGLSVISSNCGALPEIIKHGKNGLIFEEGDFSDLKNKFKKLIHDSMLRETFYQNNIKTAQYKYNLITFQKNILNLYEEVFGI